MATATHRIAAAIASQNARSIYCHSQSFQNLFLRLALANLRVNHSSFGKQDLFSDNIFQFFLFLAFHFLDFFFIHTLDHTGKQHGSYYKRDHFQRKVVSEYQRCHKKDQRTDDHSGFYIFQFFPPALHHKISPSLASTPVSLRFR